MHPLVIAAAVALVAGLATPGDAQVVVNGKQSAFAYGVAEIGLTTDPVLTATIEKGKRRRVLLVDARVSSVQGQPILLGAVPSVNGIGMLPQAAVNIACTEPAIACSLGGSWWLDLDAAEAANPGAFINQPLVIDLVAVQNFAVGNAELSIRAWLQKK